MLLLLHQGHDDHYGKHWEDMNKAHGKGTQPAAHPQPEAEMEGQVPGAQVGQHIPAQFAKSAHRMLHLVLRMPTTYHLYQLTNWGQDTVSGMHV